ncbi:unnamed protein product [Cylindrotheca closterium]|uniref:NTF2 domain-containing protein n=1 Tax=Cylindrotheca closterium TaxID=2856 RepID=A0AAD2CNV8_9STRA|nr:unnamed protein product [Cylindrotheca closterium]
MEDRHYLSEPRPIDGLKLPSWEVDIMREGVDVPILTLTVDSQTLPPRKRKKKVVWKLPDDLKTNPKFGMEDKRRILELFKQKKKELKRARKSQTTTTGGTNPNNSNQNSPGSSNGGGSKTLKRMSSSAMSVGSYMTANEEQPEDDDDDDDNDDDDGIDNDHDDHDDHDDPGESKVAEGEEKVDDNHNSVSLLSSSPPPPGFNMSGLSLGGSASSASPPPQQQKRQPPSSSTAIQPPSLPPPMPSMQPLQERSHSFAGVSRAGPPPPSSTPPLSLSNPPPIPPPPPGLNSSSRRASTSSIPPPGMNPFQQPPQSQLPQTTANMPRHFIVGDPSALGHVVMETYYLLLRTGMVRDLAQYYLPEAQKSLTVGGAHALCSDVNQRLQQLESLTNMVLQVKGVLQHPQHVGDNVYVMITGTSLRPQCLPFCHSLILKQVGPQAFQILNDALAFLTTEG